ncbi:hypothetical protein AGLY_014210 [Aphis glycines]|uniref:Uncharacterized protein n=1 Tax=Aphis glycines TaxID=307491 RepID=A0A6G0T4T0_APHGL|nr:hypothetical protein AGLY_014210 [Aphis glycines]
MCIDGHLLKIFEIKYTYVCTLQYLYQNLLIHLHIFTTYRTLGSFNIEIANSTFPSDDLDTTAVSSTCTTQLAPGGKGAPVLIPVPATDTCTTLNILEFGDQQSSLMYLIAYPSFIEAGNGVGMFLVLASNIFSVIKCSTSLIHEKRSNKFVSFNIGAIYVFSILLISVTSIIVLDSIFAFFDDGEWIIIFFPETDLKYGNTNKCVQTPADTGLPGKQNIYFFVSLKKSVTKVVGILTCLIKSFSPIDTPPLVIIISALLNASSKCLQRVSVSDTITI